MACTAPVEWTVFCDSLNTAVGVLLEADGKPVEDRAWLHSTGDKHHINVAELDAVIKGLLLAVDWKLKKLTLATDSKTVHGWVTAQLHNLKCVKISGLNEVDVNRRLQIIEEIVALHDITVNVVWVSSRENLSDCLTRVPSLLQKV